MATTNYALAEHLQQAWPHTFAALQKLVMAMADYANSRGKKTFFGRDRGLRAYKKFEDTLRDTLLAMVIDGDVERDGAADAYRVCLVERIRQFSLVFPNWQDAYAFAWQYLENQRDAANARIAALLGLQEGRPSGRA